MRLTKNNIASAFDVVGAVRCIFPRNASSHTKGWNNQTISLWLLASLASGWMRNAYNKKAHQNTLLSSAPGLSGGVFKIHPSPEAHCVSARVRSAVFWKSSRFWILLFQSRHLCSRRWKKRDLPLENIFTKSALAGATYAQPTLASTNGSLAVTFTNMPRCMHLNPPNLERGSCSTDRRDQALSHPSPFHCARALFIQVSGLLMDYELWAPGISRPSHGSAQHAWQIS